MEAEVTRLLADVQSAHEEPRRQAEVALKHLCAHEEFGPALVSIASQQSAPLELRQSAILYCKLWVQSSWSDAFEEYDGHTIVNEQVKRHIQRSMLELATGNQQDRRINGAATSVVSKIASVDFPENWPSLLDYLLHAVKSATDSEVHGALKVLYDLVDDCFSEAQFFHRAQELVHTVHSVAVNAILSASLRALAVRVFCSCFDMLEMILETNKAAIKGFVEQAVNAWNPFFLDTLNSALPSATEDDLAGANAPDQTPVFRGMVALKLQIVKTLMRIRIVFPSVLTPRSPALFSATWEELKRLLPLYHNFYIESNHDGRLEDADGLPYSLDFLVMELLDFMQGCFRAPPVRKDLESKLSKTPKDQTNGHAPADWVKEVMKLAISYAYITIEEEGMWQLDVNTFLSEEAGITANYTPRIACAELVGKLADWIRVPSIDGLLEYTREVFAAKSGWRGEEAALDMLYQLLINLSQQDNAELEPRTAEQFIEYVRYAVQHENELLRARGHLVAGSLVMTSGETLLHVAPRFMENSLLAIREDSSDVVKVSSIQAVQKYLSSMPPSVTLPLQQSIMSSLADFLSHRDLADFDDNEDVMMALLEALRDTLLLDTNICLTGTGLELLFTLASHGANNDQIATQVTEAFDEITSTLSAAGPESYSQLCSKVLPSLSNVLGLADPAEFNPLTNLAADLLATLAGNGLSPLPQGFMQAIMPPVQAIMFHSTDDELLKSITLATKALVDHDAAQVMAYQDTSAKGGLQILLLFVERLLGSELDDNAASEVGGLAAALVEKTDSAHIGNHVPQLIRAVATKLATTEQVSAIQSLTSVFARLALSSSASELLGFLQSMEIGDKTATEIVMAKWLENSSVFVGYDDIRQNVMALARLYENDTNKLLWQIQVKGDLIVAPQQMNRIKTRSQARLHPDQYTMVSAHIKLCKLLVEELVNSAGAGAGQQGFNGLGELDDEKDDDDDGEDWEDDPNETLDLRAPGVREQLMGFGMAEETTVRRADDATFGLLLDFFRRQAASPEFVDVFASLTPDEQGKLQSMAG